MLGGILPNDALQLKLARERLAREGRITCSNACSGGSNNLGTKSISNRFLLQPRDRL
jgi:hypothetical protein